MNRWQCTLVEEYDGEDFLMEKVNEEDTKKINEEDEQRRRYTQALSGTYTCTITAVQKEVHQKTFTKHKKNNFAADAESTLYFVLLRCIWHLISLHYYWQTK